MSEQSEQQADPTWPHPASAMARASQRWDPPSDDYPAAPDGTGAWAAADAPGVDPAPPAGIDGPHTRPGWLTRGLGGDGGAA